jgi:hypothetical protein
MSVFVKGIQRPSGRTVEIEQDSGDSGGSNLINTTIEISNEQILTLWSIGTILVEPTETIDYIGKPTSLPIPIACHVIGISGGGDPYGNKTSGQALQLFWGSPQDWTVAVSTYPSQDPLEGGPPIVRGIETDFLLPDEGKTTFASITPIVAIGDITDGLTDNALVLSSLNSLHDWTGGDPSNKLIVNLTYVRVPL